jgi:hypothetical protein
MSPMRWQDRVSGWHPIEYWEGTTDDDVEGERRAARELRRLRATDRQRRPRVPVTSGVWIRDQDLHSELVRWFNQRIAEYWQKVNS